MRKKKTNGVGFIVIGVILTLFALIFICDEIHVLISYDKKEATIVNVNSGVVEANVINDNTMNSGYIISKKLFQKKGDTINIYVPKEAKKEAVSRPLSFVYFIALFVGVFGIYKGSKIYKRKKRR